MCHLHDTTVHHFVRTGQYGYQPTLVSVIRDLDFGVHLFTCTKI